MSSKETFQENKVVVEIGPLLAWGLNDLFETTLEGTNEHIGDNLDPAEKNMMAMMLHSTGELISRTHGTVSVNHILNEDYDLGLDDDTKIVFQVKKDASPKIL